GVPQESALSPILSLVYCTDFPVSDSLRTKTRMYADDTALWTSQGTARKTEEEIQQQLNKIQKWANSWRVKPNDRCLREPPRLTLNNRLISPSNSVRYLGINFTHTYSLKSDLQITLKKVRNQANLLRQIRSRLAGCNPQTLVHTFNIFIRPLIEYRAPFYASLPPRLQNQIASCE
ncbi:RVT 1 domain containing protein, partial [Asbolus verrucosus]